MKSIRSWHAAPTPSNVQRVAEPAFFAKPEWPDPSEHSSGESRRQDGIAKTLGNTHARRLLVEAWHHKPRYRIGKTMTAGWDQAAPAARARGDAGNQRLQHQWKRFTERTKRPVIANVAIARELAGWCW